MSIWWSLHLRREAASVPLARRLLLGAMETAGVEPDIAYELSLALSEACANAVEHGGGPQHAGDYRVTAYLNGDMCRIEVTDHGPGFVPPALPPGTADLVETENGRGLFLINALADRVRFRNRPGDGAVVTFDKVLKWRDDAPLLAV
ncbi:ATP-binding protein [Streptomyces sp. TRM 70351]|uniref:ATP-binding protein n=1 Tax=Streptomyces sp. TRM 70351 TaxID=3116552 RepID=UPI002E7B9BA0|nr:ATP-binding protein [Streptomyces sp. TRM 70351]MEE1929943.1 ATP-binding protein [Streptomyces sp. TRM 70351]